MHLRVRTRESRSFACGLRMTQLLRRCTEYPNQHPALTSLTMATAMPSLAAGAGSGAALPDVETEFEPEGAPARRPRVVLAITLAVTVLLARREERAGECWRAHPALAARIAKNGAPIVRRNTGPALARLALAGGRCRTATRSLVAVTVIREPSGISVWQKMAFPRLTELPSLASSRLAPTRQAPLRFAPRKSPLARTAPVKLLLLRLDPRKSPSKKALESVKSHPDVFLPLPGVQLVPA